MHRAVVLLPASLLVSCADAPREGISLAEPPSAARDASASQGAPGAGTTDELDTERADADARAPGLGTTGDDASGGKTGGMNTSGVGSGGANTSQTDPSNPTPGMATPPAEPFADSGASDANPEPSTGALDDGGVPENDASVSELPTLRLDPETLSFFTVPIGSVRFAVGGHSAEHGLCASIIWWDDPARCGDLGESRGYVVLSEAAGPPCEAWDYRPNVETTRAEGCVDMRVPEEQGLVDLELDVSGELFSGRIIADNRAKFSPAPVTFGLFVATAEPGTFYVQSGGAQGGPGWVQGYRDAQEVNFFDRQGVPNCDGSASRSAVGNVQVFMQNEMTGAVFTTWDGNLYSETESAEAGGFCETREPAPPGEYSVELCFGASVLNNDSGDWVSEQVCVTEPFELPTESVVAEAQYP